VVSPYSMVNYNRKVYAFCSDNTFRMLTISSWEIASKNVAEIVRNIAFAYKENIQGVYNVEYGLMMWLIPNKESNGKLNQILTYDINETGAWGTVAVEGYCFGVVTPESSVTWDTLPFTSWQSWSWEQWDFFSSTGGFVLTNVSDDEGYVFNLFQSELDDGATYVRSFVLGTDFEGQRGMGKFKRLYKAEAFFKSEATSPKTVNMEIKHDEEASWQPHQHVIPKSIINASNNFTVVEFWFNTDKVARNFWMRFFAENAFRFLGVILYFDPDCGERFS